MTRPDGTIAEGRKGAYRGIWVSRVWPYLLLPMRHARWSPLYAWEHRRLRAGTAMYAKDRVAWLLKR